MGALIPLLPFANLSALGGPKVFRLRSAAGCNHSSSSKGIEMLVLSRKENETILIGDEILLTIVSIAGDKVRIGIDAPIAHRVLRGELELKIRDGLTPVVSDAEVNHVA